MRPVVRFAGVEFAGRSSRDRTAGQRGALGLPCAGCRRDRGADKAGDGKDRLLQHPAAGAGADLPFRHEDVQFKTRLADEKNGWCDLA